MSEYYWSDSLYRWNRLTRAGVIALGIATAPAAAAELSEVTQIHGFASQALVSTDHNNFFGDSEGRVSTRFTELGINVSALPNPDLKLAAQIISRRAGATDNGSPRLDYGFVDYRLASSQSGNIGVQFGKTKNPYGLYNDTRDVAFTRPSIILPQSIYFDRTRNVAFSATGLSLHGESSGNSDDFFWQVNAGMPEIADNSTEYLLLGANRPGEFKGRLSYVARVMYEREGGRIRLAATTARLKMHYAAGSGDPFSSGDFTFMPWLLSAQYNGQYWSFTGEYSLRETRLQGFGSLLPDMKLNGENYYLQTTYRFAPRWQGVMRYDVLYADKHDPDGQSFAIATGRPAHSRFAKDWTIGVRYDVTQSFMISAELHHVNGTGWLSPQDNLNSLATTQRWNMLLLQAAYRF